MGASCCRTTLISLITSAGKSFPHHSKVENGLLVGQDKALQNILAANNPGWTDFTVKVTYRNGTNAVIATRVVGNDGYFYTFELQRDFPNFVNIVSGGGSTGTAFGGLIETSKQQSLRLNHRDGNRFLLVHVVASRGWLAHGYCAGVVTAEHRSSRAQTETAAIIFNARIEPVIVVVALLSLAALLVTYRLNQKEYAFLPHVPDEVAYLFQADLLAHGHFTGEIRP